MRSILVTMITLGVATAELFGDDLTEPADQRRTVSFRMTNPEGEPVANVRVSALLLETANDHGHWGWDVEQHGKRESGCTDDSGKVTVTIPRYFAEKMEVATVCWQIDHPDFVPTVERVAVTDAATGVILQRGRRIAISAIEAESGDPVQTDLHVLLSGENSADEWQLIPSGILLSRVVALDRCMLRVVHTPPDGRIMFSNSIDLAEENNAIRVLRRNVPLYPGICLNGRIDPSVPRPIRNGTVRVQATDDVRRLGLGVALDWYSWSTIAEDGTFKLKNLPPNTTLQLTAICDGWISRNATHTEELDAGLLGDRNREKAAGVAANKTIASDGFVWPQVLKLYAKDVAATIEMRPTTSLTVHVKDPEGAPLADAEVSIDVVQNWYSGGIEPLGGGRNSLNWLQVRPHSSVVDFLNSDDRAAAASRCPGNGRYTVKTNRHGVATFSTVPHGTAEQPATYRVSVKHDHFLQPAPEPGIFHRWAKVSFPDERSKTIDVEMLDRANNLFR